MRAQSEAYTVEVLWWEDVVISVDYVHIKRASALMRGSLTALLYFRLKQAVWWQWRYRMVDAMRGFGKNTEYFCIGWSSDLA